MKFSIRLLYLYLFAFIGLLVTVIGAVRLVDLGLKVYVFQNADQYDTFARPVSPDGKDMPLQPDLIAQQRLENTRQRQRTTAEALAMIIVGMPLYLYHWRMIAREK